MMCARLECRPGELGELVLVKVDQLSIRYLLSVWTRSGGRR